MKIVSNMENGDYLCCIHVCCLGWNDGVSISGLALYRYCDNILGTSHLISTHQLKWLPQNYHIFGELVKNRFDKFGKKFIRGEMGMQFNRINFQSKEI